MVASFKELEPPILEVWVNSSQLAPPYFHMKRDLQTCFRNLTILLELLVNTDLALSPKTDCGLSPCRNLGRSTDSNSLRLPGLMDRASNLSKMGDSDEEPTAHARDAFAEGISSGTASVTLTTTLSMIQELPRTASLSVKVRGTLSSQVICL